MKSPTKLAPLNVLHQPQQSSVHSSAVGSFSCRHVQKYGAVTHKTALAAKRAQNLTFSQKNTWFQTQ
jgi:hypothetical protein